MAQKKKTAKVQQDQLTLKIPNLYKKKCQANGIPVSKVIKQKLQMAIQTGKLQTLQLWQDLGPLQMRSLMEALCQLSYPHLKKLRVWKINLCDQGVRSICNYIQKMNSIEYLDLMDNNITCLGCQFLGKIFAKENCAIKKFRIDNNNIGNQGMKNLAMGLRLHSQIEKLSFNYCNFDQAGVKYVQEIMANIQTKIRTLKVQGNPLGNQGVYQILRAVKNCGDFLEKLNICDVGMNIFNYKADLSQTIQEKIANQMVTILENNQSIAKYNFKNNWIPDVVAKFMIDAVKQNKNILMIQMPQSITHVLKEMQNQILKKRKPKKKGKGKKKSAKAKK